MDKFVVTISRGYGSGGKQIGIMLAEQLGVEYYDQDILHFASEDSGINLSLFAKSDERVRAGATLRASLTGGAYDGSVITPDKKGFVSDENLFNYQAKVIKELAEKESCVIIGRAADYLLRDMPNVLSINIQASYEDSIQNVIKTKGVTEKEAQRLIKKINKERADFYYYYTGRRWDDEMNFDLTINTSRVDWPTAVKLIRAYMEMKLNGAAEAKQ